jgi:hypothetical protein
MYYYNNSNYTYECILTGQAADMAAIILDHIRQIMAEQEAAEGEA